MQSDSVLDVNILKFCKHTELNIKHFNDTNCIKTWKIPSLMMFVQKQSEEQSLQGITGTKHH